MTEDQKAMSLLLELLAATKGVPITAQRLAQEAKFSGMKMDAHGILESMEDRKLVESFRDALGIRRYFITAAGKEVLYEL